MSWMHAKAVTKDAGSLDKAYRELVENKYMIWADPSQRDRYPVGYWEACWDYWNEVNPQGDFVDGPKRWLAGWWREVCYRVEYALKRHLGVGL